MSKTLKELSDEEILERKVPDLLVRKLKYDWENSADVFEAIRPQTSKRIPYKYPKWVLDNHGDLHLIAGYYQELDKLCLFSLEVGRAGTFFWWWNIDEKKKLISRKFNKETYLTVSLIERLGDAVQRKFKLTEDIFRKEDILNKIPVHISPFKMNIRNLQKRKENLDGIK